jgi:hypothetical protein
MVTIAVNSETSNQDGSVECTESSAISSLCFGCASVLITEAVIDKKLTEPNMDCEEKEEVVEERDGTLDCLNDNFNDKKKEKSRLAIVSYNGEEDLLQACCLENGFYLALRCSDGISHANSQLFTWMQIAQMLIAFDPDMFGILDEPLHRVFPESLRRLGFYVPGWQG